MPLGMERSVQKTRRLSTEKGVLSTDSEDLNGSVKERRRRKRHKRSQKANGEGSEETFQQHKDANKPESEPASSATKQQLQTSANKHKQGEDKLEAGNKPNVPGECEMWFIEPVKFSPKKLCCKSPGFILDGTFRTLVFLKIHCRKEKL